MRQQWQILTEEEKNKILNMHQKGFMKEQSDKETNEQSNIVGNIPNFQGILKQFPNAREIFKSCADELNLDIVKKFFTPENPNELMGAILNFMNPFGGDPKVKFENEIKELTACVRKKAPEMAKILSPVKF